MTPLYDQIEPRLNSADLILFRGNGRTSKQILFADSLNAKAPPRFSHVGYVLRREDGLYSVEAVMEHGVVMMPLRCRLAVYDGVVSVRLLNWCGRDDQSANVETFTKQHLGTPYETSRLELARSAFDGPLGKNRENLESLFCSELTAELYQHLALLAEPPARSLQQ